MKVVSLRGGAKRRAKMSLSDFQVSALSAQVPGEVPPNSSVGNQPTGTLSFFAS